MAIAGDVVIKLAADFAEFTKGMSESTAKLEDFGKKAASVSDGLSTAFSVLKVAGGVTAILGVIKSVVDEADRLEKKFTDIAAQAEKLGTSFDTFEKLRLSALSAGQGTDKLTDAMTRFKGVTDQAIAGNAQTIAMLDKLGVTVLNANGKLRDQAEINAMLARSILAMPEGIEKMRTQMALLGTTGDAANKTLTLLAQSGTDLNSKFDTLNVGKTVQELDALRKQSELAKEKFDLLAASLLLPIEVAGLNAAASAMAAIVNAINAVQMGSIEGIMKLLGAVSLIGLGPAGIIPGIALFKSIPDAAGVLDSQIKSATESVKVYEDALVAAEHAGDAFAGDAVRAAASLEQANKKLADLEFQREKLRPSTEITITKPGRGSNPPPVATGGRGGGAGDDDNIERQIKRYEALGAAAQKSYGVIIANQSKAVDELTREVTVQQQIDDIVAKITAKKGRAPTDEEIARLRVAVTLNQQQRDENAKLLQYNQQAAALEERLGNGQSARTRAMRDLNKEMATGRLSVEAYNRAVKEQQETIDQAALAAKRYDDDLGSLGAGFEHAANAFARSHDLFSTGEQAFSGLTDAMSQGLDALAGKSDKTFSQIASDFALMLAKMAVQAAASQVFKTVFGSISGTFMGSEPFGPPAPAASLTARAGGGDVDPANSYRVGEYGPEVFSPKVAGTIKPMAHTSSGDVTVQLDMRGNSATQGATPDQAVAFGRKVKAAVSDVIATEKLPGGSLYRRAG